MSGPEMECESVSEWASLLGSELEHLLESPLEHLLESPLAYR